MAFDSTLLNQANSYGFQLPQCCTDRRGAHRTFGQVHTHTGNGIGPAILSVHGAVDIHHDALGVGQDGEIANVAHGPHQFGQHRSCSLHQRAAGFLHLAHARGADRIKAHALARFQSPGLAAFPAALQPGRQRRHGSAAAFMQKHLTGWAVATIPLTVGIRGSMQVSSWTQTLDQLGVRAGAGQERFLHCLTRQVLEELDRVYGVRSEALRTQQNA